MLFFHLCVAALLRRSRELGCPNACPWMSRLKPWDSARGPSRSQSSLHPHPDPDGMVAGPGARGWIVRWKRPPSSWAASTLGFLVQISSQMVAGCLCWAYAR